MSNVFPPGSQMEICNLHSLIEAGALLGTTNCLGLCQVGGASFWTPFYFCFCQLYFNSPSILVVRLVYIRMLGVQPAIWKMGPTTPSLGGGVGHCPNNVHIADLLVENQEARPAGGDGTGVLPSDCDGKSHPSSSFHKTDCHHSLAAHQRGGRSKGQ